MELEREKRAEAPWKRRERKSAVAHSPRAEPPGFEVGDGDAVDRGQHQVNLLDPEVKHLSTGQSVTGQSDV